VIVRLALLGGDAALDEELRAALMGLPEIALLAAAHSADADMLLAADSSGAAAGDLVRAERARRADARILLVAPARSENAAQQALECGAVGVVERPIDAPALRHALAAAGCFDAGAGSRAREHEGHVALLGAGGGMGTTTCAVALAAAHERVFLLDLALATGDAADVAAAHVAVPDALLRLACGPMATPAELTAGLAHADACEVLPAPSLPEQADLIDERGIARVLDLAVASGLRAIVDCGARVGVETIPVLERAGIVVIVASADARGARGARRTALLIARLGLSARLAGVVATGSRSPRAGRSLAALTGLPLVATVKADPRVARARERGLPPPGAAFAALALLAGAAAR
jgi:Flp pilus assembly CpaE family ATPase